MVSKPICLHFHIFKNAGTTVEWILKKNFSKDAVTIDPDDPKTILSYEHIFDFLKKNSNVIAFSSHQIRFPVPIHPNFEFLPILFLRHPIDRAFSIYSFQRKRTDANRLGIIKAKQLSLNDYLKWNFQNKKFRPLKNFQVLFLSDKDVESEVDLNDLKIAIERVKECLIIGIVDRFDESMILAEEILRKYFPNIDLSYVKQNVSKERNADLNQRINADKSKLDEAVWNRLLNENELDLELYKEANKEIDNRLKGIDDFENKLSNFERRCKQLQNSADLG